MVKQLIICIHKSSTFCEESFLGFGPISSYSISNMNLKNICGQFIGRFPSFQAAGLLLRYFVKTVCLLHSLQRFQEQMGVDGIVTIKLFQWQQHQLEFG